MGDKITLESNITLSGILQLLGVLIIPLVIWGMTIERRFEKVLDNSSELLKHERAIESIKKVNESNYKALFDIMVDIKLELKDKANR